MEKSYLGAPPMTSMAAAGAPAMTSMYTPVTSQFAPAASVVTARPATTFAAPPVPINRALAAAPVAAPSLVSAVPPLSTNLMPQSAMPTPASLTAGLPEPAKLEAQKVAFEQALELQLQKQIKAVLEEAEIKKLMLDQSAKTQLEQSKLTIDEQFHMACLQVDKEKNTTINGLKEAAILQQTSTEERAAIAIAEYNKKAALEVMAAKSYGIQKQWHEHEVQLMAQFEAVRQAGGQNSVLSTAGLQNVGAVM